MIFRQAAPKGLQKLAAIAMCAGLGVAGLAPAGLGVQASLAQGAAVVPAALNTTGPNSAGLTGTARITPFMQSMAERLSGDRQLQEFYRARNYAPLWTGTGEADRARRAALLAAMQMAPLHGLPGAVHDPEAMIARLRGARTASQRAALDVTLTREYLALARQLDTGLLRPRDVVSEILRDVRREDPEVYLEGILQADPMAYVRALPPQNAEYVALMKARMQLIGVRDAGGYGPKVRAEILRPGDSGAEVVSLRNRLIATGHLGTSVTTRYDRDLEAAVARFQERTGLAADGVAGPATLEQLNLSVEERLHSVLVAMERERWLNIPRGDRHVLVNLTDFSAKIIDFDEVTFRTRSVIGMNTSDRRTPEFSDSMRYLMINPTWHVPRSIVVKEYLPQMQQNPNAASQLNLYDSSGRVVPREAVDFSQYDARSFPFAMKQPPSDYNALGLVKFMFPNANNIYLHDTPSKSLFQRSVRAFSHGCVRLQDPFDFAYALLARQEDNPQRYFQRILATGTETRVNLDQPVPIHLIYRTAVALPKGGVGFRADIYGRDRQIWDALAAQGVTLDPVSG